MIYECVICGHQHDETLDGPWSEVPEDFECPECGVGKSDYEPFEQ